MNTTQNSGIDWNHEYDRAEEIGFPWQHEELETVCEWAVSVYRSRQSVQPCGCAGVTVETHADGGRTRAQLILECRDALVVDDHESAWNALYWLAESYSNDPLKPWSGIESAALLSQQQEPTAQSDLSGKVLLWCGEVGGYWLPQGRGYTADRSKAWPVTREYAESVCADMGPEKQMEIRPVFPSQQQEPTGRVTVEDVERLAADARKAGYTSMGLYNTPKTRNAAVVGVNYLRDAIIALLSQPGSSGPGGQRSEGTIAKNNQQEPTGLRDKAESTLYEMLTEVHLHGDSAIQGAEILASFLDGEDPDGGEIGIAFFCSDFAEKVFGESPQQQSGEEVGEVTQYCVHHEPYRSSVFVQGAWQPDGSLRWKIIHGNVVLNKSGEWEFEPMPSGRDDAFYQRTRWETAGEAAAAWKSAVQQSGPNSTKENTEGEG